MGSHELDSGQVVINTETRKKVLLVDTDEKQISLPDGDVYMVITTTILPLPNSGLELASGKAVQKYYYVVKGVPLTAKEVGAVFDEIVCTDKN